MSAGIEALKTQAADYAALAVAAREADDESKAETYFRRALALAVGAVNRAADQPSIARRVELLRVAAGLALECGEVAEGGRLMEEALAVDASTRYSDEWAELWDVGAWPDSWLIAAVRRDPPDAAALDALANRYWKPLFGRCQLLTVNLDKANDLAQQAWCRVLRARHGLKPGGNFPAYLAVVATNLWRDAHRGARRAGAMAEDRLASLDEAFPTEDGESIVLADVVPDLNSLGVEDQTLLKCDLDRALKELAPQLREVLVARFIYGESSAEIGRRYGRTEQSISGWVRQAIHQMKIQLEAPARKALMLCSVRP